MALSASICLVAEGKSEKTTSKKLQTAFTKHESETKKKVDRLNQVFELLGKRAAGKKCPAIDGIIEQASEVMKEAKDDIVRDAAMLTAAQSVITRFPVTARLWRGPQNEHVQGGEVASGDPGRREGNRCKIDRLGRCRDQHRSGGR
jgi:Domain of unknown function (DUF892)